MNFNTNMYQNYPFMNSYGQQYIPQPMMQQPVQQVQPMPQSLNGKIVDSVDMVKVTEVPVGGYGVFPKADLSEIYIKAWNNNGTTNTIVYKPSPQEVTPVATNEPTPAQDSLQTILDQIAALNDKIDNLVTPKKKEGLSLNAY